ncbi:MAG: hypothetical protein EOO81_00585 [Oxalobacteraceae bacterium]|nr:MAG: hypothetical protein EOO81_00585 [Oxalobacteraceae bacterium]
MPFENPAFVELKAAVERDLTLYRRVMQKRKQRQQSNKEHPVGQSRRADRQKYDSPCETEAA